MLTLKLSNGITIDFNQDRLTQILHHHMVSTTTWVDESISVWIEMQETKEEPVMEAEEVQEEVKQESVQEPVKRRRKRRTKQQIEEAKVDESVNLHVSTGGVPLVNDKGELFPTPAHLDSDYISPDVPERYREEREEAISQRIDREMESGIQEKHIHVPTFREATLEDGTVIVDDGTQFYPEIGFYLTPENQLQEKKRLTAEEAIDAEFEREEKWQEDQARKKEERDANRTIRKVMAQKEEEARLAAEEAEREAQIEEMKQRIKAEQEAKRDAEMKALDVSNHEEVIDTTQDYFGLSTSKSESEVTQVEDEVIDTTQDYFGLATKKPSVDYGLI